MEEEREEQQPEQENNNTTNTSNLISSILGIATKFETLKLKIIIIAVIIGFFAIIFFLLLLFSSVFIFISKEETNSQLNYSQGDIATAYAECTSVKIQGVSGVVSLEEYVMGVVSAEAYTDQGIEALKAQAIAARTYVIMRTNYCKNAIRNSSSDQNFTSNIKENARTATEATAGIVLSYNSKMFASQYDSFYKGRDFGCAGGTCSVTYKKEPNGEEHKVSVPSSYSKMMAGGHGYGMSQVASYYLASKGYTYEQILKYFYSSGVELTKLSPSPTTSSLTCGNNAQSITYNVRSSTPTSNDKYFLPPYVGNHNRGQCVWYVKGRANEMIANSSLEQSVKTKLMNAITNTYGDARKWWNNSSLSIFKSSNDYKQAKAGSIIVWEYGSERIAEKGGNNYGHVAIIESISNSGQVVVTEGWANGGSSCPNSWGCVVFKNRKFNSLEEFYTWVRYYGSNANRYKFLGYIYLFC